MQFDSEMLCVQNTFLANLFSLQNILCKNCCVYKTFFVTLQPISKFICKEHTKIYILWMLYLSTIKSY